MYRLFYIYMYCIPKNMNPKSFATALCHGIRLPHYVTAFDGYRSNSWSRLPDIGNGRNICKALDYGAVHHQIRWPFNTSQLVVFHGAIDCSRRLWWSQQRNREIGNIDSLASEFFFEFFRQHSILFLVTRRMNQ